jgi:hypothetical protein
MSFVRPSGSQPFDTPEQASSHDVDPAYWRMLGPEQSLEVVVRTRILAVINCLNPIQQRQESDEP